MAMDALIEQVPVFQSLSAERLKKIRTAGLMEHYARNAVIFHQGQRAEAMWIVLSGWVHLLRLDLSSTSGKEGVVIFTVTPDEGLCGLSATGKGFYNVTGIAATDCYLFRIPSEVLQEALRSEAAFAYAVLRLCARRLTHIAEQYGSLAEPVPARIGRAILRLQAQFGNQLPITHRELAQMAWTTTESAIRAVRQLKQQGYVQGARGRLQIAGVRKLEGWIAQSSHPSGNGAAKRGG